VTDADASQLALEGMPRRLFTCTPTRLTTWLDCPRRYRFTYLDRPQPPKGPPWAHNSLGASVHNALAAWWRLPLERRTPERAGSLLVSGFVADGFRDDAQAARWRERGREMVEAYVATLDPTEEPVGVERTVALRTDVLAVSGRVDRIDLRGVGAGEELVVVDYKTGRSLLTVHDAKSSLALAVYAAAAARTLRRPCSRVELHHLPTGQVVGHEHTAESLARHLSRAERIAEEASAAEDFPPKVGPSCAWCDFARHCPEGRTAFPSRRSWDGLAPDDDAL
jgi:putative RecB family exonuclease